MTKVRVAAGLFSFLLAALIPSTKLFAQSKSTKVTITPVEIWSGRTAVGNEDPDWRFRLFYEGSISNDCIGVDNSSSNTWIGVPDTRQFLVSDRRVTDFTQDIQIGLEAFEEDGCGDGCEYKATTWCGESSDDAHCGFSNQPINLYNFTPGAPGAINDFTLRYCAGTYAVRYRVAYAPPAPAKPGVIVDGATYTDGNLNLCGHNTVELSTATALKPAFHSQVTYTWQYNINGENITETTPNPAYCGDLPECNEPVDQGGPGGVGRRPACCDAEPDLVTNTVVWRTISTTTNAAQNGGNISFDIRSLQELADIKTNTTIQFRVKASANGITGEPSASSITVNVSPLPPTIGSVTYVASCPNKRTGEVHLNGVRGIGSYQYMLRSGHYNNSSCSPDNNTCFSADITGSASGADFVIPNVPDGKFTVWLVNKATNSGSCSITYNEATVPVIPRLSASVAQIQNVQCNGLNEGSVTLNYSGGISPYTFSLTGQTSNSSGVFSGLSAGNYTGSVTDGCGQTYPETVISNITVTQPPKIIESVFSSTNATCETPGNGKFTADVAKTAGTYDTSVPFTYRFDLSKDGTVYDSHESTTPGWVRQNLPTGDYQLVVRQKNGADCNSYVKNFNIAPPPAMSVSTPTVAEVSCYGGNDGYVAFIGSGGSGNYIFKMTQAPGDTVENATGEFTALTAGNYSLFVRNGLPGCKDTYDHPSTIIVTQPDKIIADLTKTDISCYGLVDGKIEASISGGTPGYRSTWEQLIGSAWSTLSSTETSITNRGEGTYRLMVLDSRNCKDSSASVSIIEPAPLEIKKVTVNDIKCFNEKGQIDIESIGGTGRHSYFYSLDNGIFTSFDKATDLSAGSYKIKVEDANQCVYDDTDSYLITAPPTPLDFTYVLSDFNGYNISCYGGSNGTITITPTGGNGARYSGYEYSNDHGTYQSENLISKLDAGSHIIAVRDDRGCVVSKNIQFTQTDAEITLSLRSKQDIVCYGDHTGVLELQAAGGLSPYVFAIDDGVAQTSAIFSGLAAKTYRATVLDKNNCDASIDYTISHINPKIDIQATIQHVSCFDGEDGFINLTVTGGVSPLRYLWEDQNNITTFLSDLETGSYTILVTDNAGCEVDSTFLITQPEKPLSAKIGVVPVCAGRNNGVITVTPGGGTSPYRYSVDNGGSYQSEPVFNTVGVGEYIVKVIDSKGCTTTGSANIIKRNDLPVADFIVATKEHALDTLLIREISIPKPDSIHWTFTPSGTVVNNDQWSPQVVFAQSGEYVITMTGYFQACDYTTSRVISLNPFDPEAVRDKTPGTKAIESVEVSPNPNAGEFDVSIKLNKKYRLSLIVYDVLGTSHYNKSWEAVQEAAEKISIRNVSSGVYVLRAITDNDAKDVRIIINK